MSETVVSLSEQFTSSGVGRRELNKYVIRLRKDAWTRVWAGKAPTPGESQRNVINGDPLLGVTGAGTQVCSFREHASSCSFMPHTLACVFTRDEHTGWPRTGRASACSAVMLLPSLHHPECPPGSPPLARLGSRGSPIHVVWSGSLSILCSFNSFTGGRLHNCVLPPLTVNSDQARNAAPRLLLMLVTFIYPGPKST